MTEEEKSRGTDEQIELSESFTLEPLRLIQTRDFDHSVRAISKEPLIYDNACMFSDGWNEAFWNSESVKPLRHNMIPIV